MTSEIERAPAQTQGTYSVCMCVHIWCVYHGKGLEKYEPPVLMQLSCNLCSTLITLLILFYIIYLGLIYLISVLKQLYFPFVSF